MANTELAPSFPEIAAPLSASLLARMVRREIPASLSRFSVLIACIAIGVASIVAVASLSRALNDGIGREGRVILGGDAAFSLIQREASAAEQAVLARHGALSRVIASRAMARNARGESALVEIKAVDAAYPVAGALGIDGENGPISARVMAILAPRSGDDSRPGLLADPLLAGRLDIKINETLAIGDLDFRLAGFITSEPDKLSGGMGFGPRVIMRSEDIRRTGLIQPGALTRFIYRLDLSAGGSDADVEAALASIAKEAPDAGWQIASRMRAAPQLQRQIARFTQFLTLVGLTALLVGGVGVANASHGFAQAQIRRIATLKSLGASRRFVFVSALTQVMAFALIGIVIGLLLGAALPFLAASLLKDLLPFPLSGTIYASELALGLAYGLVSAVTFSLLPVLRARAVPASMLFRDEAGQSAYKPSLPDMLLLGGAGLAFGALAIFSATDQRIAWFYLAAALGAFLILRLVAIGVMALARHAPRPAHPIFRLAIGNLHRPGSLTPSVILSLGLGLTLLVALTLIDFNLARQLRASLSSQAPSFFFIDIPSRQIDAFDAALRGMAPGAVVERVPQLRGRITALNGVPAAEIAAAERVSWVLDGDRGITYAATPPEGSVLAVGAWWPADYRGPPLVSFAKDVADGLGLKVGDEVSLNILGRPLNARIANLRDVRWQRLGINFVMVFSPNTFVGAPHSFLATLALPGGGTPAQELAITRAVGKEFPAISSVRVKDALAAIDAIVTQLALAIRVSSGIALLTSILVLGGALAASTRQRQRDGIVLKTLGATRLTLLAAMTVEYALLGAIAVVFGLICGALGAYFIVTAIMNAEFAFSWQAAASIAVIALFATIILGLAGTWHILGQKPAPYLRNS